MNVFLRNFINNGKIYLVSRQLTLIMLNTVQGVVMDIYSVTDADFFFAGHDSDSDVLYPS